MQILRPLRRTRARVRVIEVVTIGELRTYRKYGTTTFTDWLDGGCVCETIKAEP